METRYLKEFISLSETLSYFETSEQFFISKSALTKHIQALEKEVGIPLFNRTGRGVVLNETGHKFLIYARKMIELQEQFFDELIMNKSLSISVSYDVESLLIDFQKNNKDISLQVIQMPRKRQIEELKKGKTDFAFIFMEKLNFDPAIKYQLLCEDEIVFIVNKEHPLANRKYLTFDDVKNEDFVLTYETDQIISEQIKLNVIATVATGDQLINYVRQNIAITLLTRYACEKSLDETLTVIPVYPPIKDHVYFCTRKGNSSFIQNKFINYMQKYFSEI